MSDFDDIPPGHARRALRLFYGLIGVPSLEELDEASGKEKKPEEAPAPAEE